MIGRFIDQSEIIILILTFLPSVCFHANLRLIGVLVLASAGNIIAHTIKLLELNRGAPQSVLADN